MKTALDSSVLVDALNRNGAHHAEALEILGRTGLIVGSHCLTETFSTLTGEKLGFRVPASQAADILKHQIAPRLKIISLTPTELLKAYAEAQSRGIRGGAIYDYLHLFAARKAGADRFHALSLRDFLAFQRPNDPEIIGL